MALLLGGIWDFADRFARLRVLASFDGASSFSLSLSSGDSSSMSFDVAERFLPAVDRRFRFLPMISPSSRRFCRFSACALTSAGDILTQRILPDSHPSCKVRMSLRLPMVDGLANTISAGQPIIFTLRPWTMLSS